MLTQVKAYSSLPSPPTLLLDENGREETDLIQVRDIQGLDPVKAAVSTTNYGSVDGAAFTGASVSTRNIVLTLHPNPDWKTWTYESLRRLVYSYFMPKLPVRLVFYSDDISPVVISGIVESCVANPFVKDVEMVVSIICPDPYFTDLNPTVITGNSSDGTVPTEIQYDGDIEAAIQVEVTRVADPAPTTIGIQIGDPALSYFNVIGATVNANMYFIMSSQPGQKYVQNVQEGSGVITNLLNLMQRGSSWPKLQPGSNDFSVITDHPGNQFWTLTYYTRRGGL